MNFEIHWKSNDNISVGKLHSEYTRNVLNAIVNTFTITCHYLGKLDETMKVCDKHREVTRSLNESAAESVQQL